MSRDFRGAMVWCRVCKRVYGAWEGDAALEDAIKDVASVCCDRTDLDIYELHPQIKYLAATPLGALQDVAIANDLLWDKRTKRGVTEHV